MIFYCLGLDITKDRILEIACIITDGKLTKRIEVDIETKHFYYLAVVYNVMIC
jgi:oligoribonuclease (3'-5' exoribonuclease)